MRRLFVALGILFLVCPDTLALTLHEAMNEVISTHPEILEKEKDYNFLRNEVMKSRSMYQPTLDIEAKAGWEIIKNPSTRLQNKQSDINSTRVVLRQELFDSHGTSSLVGKSTAELEAAKFNYLEQVNKKVFETSEIYLNLLKNVRLVSLAEENIEIHEKILKSIDEKVKAKMGSQSEYNRVAGRLAMANSKFVFYNNSLKESIYFLHKLIGRFVKVDSLTKPKFDDNLLPSNLEKAAKKQSAVHPLLKSAEQEFTAKEHEYKLAKADNLPKFELEVSNDINRNMAGINGREKDFQALFKVSYNLFDGGYNRYDRKAKVSKVHSQQEIIKALRRTLINDLQLSWTGYQMLKKQITALKKNSFYLKKTLKSYKEEYTLGKRRLINLLDAENEFYNSKVLLIDTQFKLLLQKYKLLNVIGDIYQALKLDLQLDGYDTAKNLTTGNDTYPLDPDFDYDLDKVFDRKDICPGSLPGSEVLTHGCDKASSSDFVNVSLEEDDKAALPRDLIKSKKDLVRNRITKDKVTILDYISFIPGKAELSRASKQLLRTVLSQLKVVSMGSIVEIKVGTNEMKDEIENISLSVQRGYLWKKNFVLNGIDAEAINIHPLKNSKKANIIHLFVTDDPENADLDYNVIEDPKVYFKEKEVALTDLSKRELKKIAKRLKNMMKDQIDVLVFTKEYKRDVDNDRLSQNRAEFIKQYLKDKGVKSRVITAFGMGRYHQSLVGGSDKSNFVEFVIR